MKIKLDENIPVGLVHLLVDLGHNTDTVRDEGLTGREDAEIWLAAQKESRFFITQDLDFSDSRKFLPGTHAGILLVRLHSPGGSALRSRIQEIFRTESVGEWPGCFVVVTERKVRIQRPPH